MITFKTIPAVPGTEVLLSKDIIVASYNKLKTLRDMAAALPYKPENEEERRLLSTKIRTAREEYKSCHFNVYMFSLRTKQQTYKKVFTKYPDVEELRKTRKAWFQEIVSERLKNKRIKKEEHTYNGIEYETVGGVFSKPAIEWFKETSPRQRILTHKKPHAKIKSSYVGIELELIANCSYSEMADILADEGFASYVNCGTDGSIRGMTSGEYGVEVRVLCKQEEVSWLIPKLTATLKDKCKARVTNSCGMHVHFDMRYKDVGVSYNNIRKILPLLTKMVPHTRVDGEQSARYCSLDNRESFEAELQTGNRYKAINTQSYSKFKTLEVRLHSGTLNASKIVNWITIITTAINSPFIANTVDSAAQYAATFECSTKLIEYIDKRIATFANRQPESYVSTEQDETNNNNLELVA